jgi:phosphodiesterase/alkaline phosphatase D-like protein
LPFIGSELTFTTNALGAPVVTTDNATVIDTTIATLNGMLDDVGTADNVTVSFSYGTAVGGPYTTPVAVGTMTDPGAFSANLTGLTPGTPYYYIAKAVGADGSGEGNQVSFTTLTTPPSVTTGAATNPATTSATLNGNLTDLGTASSVIVSFEWGLTTSYGSVAAGTPPSMTAPGNFSANLTGLTAKTTYHFKAIAAGDGTTPGSDMTFTTSTIAPSVTTGAATNPATTSATLNGNLGSLGTATSVNVSFEWGTTTSYGTETTAQSMTAIGAFTANRTGLTDKTTYHFRAKAVGDGSAVYGDDMTFTTASPADTTEPTISLVNASEITTSGATVTWTTNEAATSQVEYGLTEEYGSVSPLDASLVNSHSVDLTGLKAGKTYHYRVISKDAANNQAVSADATFKTAASSGGMPVWAWVLIGLAAVGVLGAAAYFIRGRLAQG